MNRSLKGAGRKMPEKKTERKCRQEQFVKKQAQRPARKLPYTEKLYDNEILKRETSGVGIMLPFIAGVAAFSLCLILISVILALRASAGGGDFMYSLTQDYVPGIVFGITFLIFAAIGADVDGSFKAVRNIFPRCGHIRYSREQIDRQASDLSSEYVSEFGLILAPEILIGCNDGVRVVTYEEIKSIRMQGAIRLKSRINNGPKRKHYRNIKTFFVRKIVVRTNYFERITVSVTTGIYPEAYKRLCDGLLPRNPEIRVLETRKSLLE